MFEFPIVSVLIFLPSITSVFVLFSNEDNPQNAKLVGIWGSFVVLALSFIVLFNFDFDKNTVQHIDECAWLPIYNIKYKVGIDKFSILFICMTATMSFLSILWLSKKNIDRQKHFLVSILLCESLAIGTFAAYDLFLMLFFMEAIMIPVFVMIYSANKRYSRHAAFQFLFYSMASALCTITAFIIIYNNNGTSDILRIYEHGQLRNTLCFWILFAGIAIKIPTFPFHYWVPTVHSDSPTTCSVILGAIALKFATIVIIKILYHVFFDELVRFTDIIAIICLVSSAIACAHLFIQDDLKKFFAYFTVLHMNMYMFILLSGIGIKNFVFAVLYHSFIITILFFISDIVKAAFNTRSMTNLRFVESRAIKHVMAVVFFMLIGSPATWGFFVEITTMYSAYKLSPIYVAFLGLIILSSSAYTFWLYYNVFGAWKTGMPNEIYNKPTASKKLILITLFGIILFFGFMPRFFLDIR
ncbi:MAG: hypothetical protein LBG13_00090 [Holosporales bacterium]|jgi:NADH-quinone oxidoreductase subunit M|nr:hypothetical protein [Holosporales bacterium]